MSKLVEMQKQRTAHVKSMRAFIDSIDSKTGQTEEQSAQFEAMNADLVKLDESIKAEQTVTDLECSLSEITDAIHRPSPESNKQQSPFSSVEYTDGYEKFVRGGLTADIKAVLSEGTDTEGGFTVPKTWATELIHKLTANVIMRQLATVISTDNDRNLPLVTDNGLAGWVDEKASYPESDIVFGNAALEAWKLGRIIKVSEELLQDTGVDLVAEISRIFGMTFGLAEESAFFVGNGVKKPTGVMVTGQVGKTAASATAITYDELVDLEYSVREPYRVNGTWVTAGATAGMLRKLKSTDGVPLWQPSLQAGQPDMFNGKPLHTTEAIAAVATGALVMAFGDFSEYRIADRGAIYMQRLDELYASTGMVGFRMRKRVDGKLAVPEAVKTLQMA